LQRVRDAIESDIRSDAALESTPRAELANAAGGEGQHRALHLRRRPFDDVIGQEKSGFDLDGFEAPVQGVHAGTPRPFHEQRASPAVVRLVPAVRGSDR
jgi:hypothetical protein